MLLRLGRNNLRRLASSCTVRAIVSMSVPPDVKEFLDGYPAVDDDPSLAANLSFYRNQTPCRPDNLRIDEIHERFVYSRLPHALPD